jgi:uncharacterized membrane protein YraQ (UPF0718 family)
MEYLLSIIEDFWGTVADMSPYLLFGFLVAGALSVLMSQQTVTRHLGGRGIWPLVKASVLGVPLPLCSCGVIPVSMSLHQKGASKGAAISFLLSTPQTGVDSIFVTLSLLGPVFAIFRPVAALITGLVGGTLVNIFDRTSTQPAPDPEESAPGTCCHAGKQPSKVVRALRYGFLTLPRNIGRAMLVGLLLAAVISALIPDDFFVEHLGHGILPLLVMMVLGIPVYVCATASVPVAAALILKGLSPGAALVFLMTGPATNAASLITIARTLGLRTAVIYLLTVAGCALGSGVLLDSLATSLDVGDIGHCAWMLPGWLKTVSALVLFVVLGYALATRASAKMKG